MTDKELKITDLMVGDWVIFHESSKVSRKCIVRNIDKDSNLIVEWIDDDDIYSELTHDISPVPLTPEILEKNGFENIGDDTYQLEEKPCWFWVDFFNHQYGCEYDTSTYEYEDDEHRLKLYGIPSVHELQHALRLCGIEKEIEL